MSRISESTNGFLRGSRPNIVGDPAAGEQTANLFWFNPNAYAPAADGTFGNSGRAEFRQPGPQSDRPVVVEELALQPHAAHCSSAPT